jgi:hypothetical protein
MCAFGKQPLGRQLTFYRATKMRLCRPVSVAARTLQTHRSRREICLNPALRPMKAVNAGD